MTSALRPTGQGIGTGASERPVLDRTALRLVFLIPGGLALLLGLDAALLLLGVWAPLSIAQVAQLHGPLMVFGFVGTLIVLERAVAARRVWGFAAPALLGLGSLLLLSPLPDAVGKTMVLLGFCALLGVYLVIRRRSPAAAIDIQILGAVAGVTASILWLSGASISAMVPGMAAFLILTIAGERLELARISPVVDARAESLGLAASMLVVATAAIAPLWPEPGYPLLGVALALLVVWLFRYDVATRLAATTGLPRYMAICLLAGYVWLVVAAGVWVVAGEAGDGPRYDAVLHSIFLGFVMSMIMAHAPVILPAVLRKPLPYRWFLYLPVALLHLSLVVRLLGGDAWGSADAIRVGGVLNVIAVLLFAALAVTTAVMGPPASRKARGEKGPDSVRKD
ncbi:hypothetical protein BKA04_001695 [Cryobacterium mesophilum]|uniref:hypothetical protein n=1 Tax=Terrimesophilobacter mesophilus TaxID=433647 RepID=UPI00184CBFB3|nr:hypothetical protein [Terrimesophilobacter mesophilus]MBB5633472.1 hypothetical protein [Terrimesophilobacter mesophilus]